VVTIHYEPSIAWQARRINQFSSGLTALGIHHRVTTSRKRISDVAVLFGTTFFDGVKPGGDWLLVDRASIGDPDYVRLVWNGSNHRVPVDHDDSRWIALGVELQPKRAGDAVVICVEADGSYPDVIGTHARIHPRGFNPTGLPRTDWIDGTYHVLRSSVAVESIIRGYPTVVYDPSSVAYGVTDRESWAHWLAWAQWRWDEIEAGEPMRHLWLTR
jgi:hypothetical protein